MIKLTALLLSLLFGQNLLAQVNDFYPYVMISNIKESKLRQFSGVVINQDDEFYYVLTVNHCVDDIAKPDLILQTTVIPINNDKYLGSAIKTTIIKRDEPKDIALMKFYKLPHISIKPMTLGQEELVAGTNVVSYGFINSPILKTNKVIFRTYKKHSYKDIPYMTCEGVGLHGMSGGPLVYKNQVYGIQSSAGNNDILYLPVSQINIFMKD